MEALEMAQDKAVEPMDAMDEALASPSVNFPATASLWNSMSTSENPINGKTLHKGPITRIMVM